MSFCKTETNEKENNTLVAINSNIPLSTILELNDQEENRKILDYGKPIKSYFQNCYNDQSARCVSNYRFLERYFINIEAKHPEICRSVMELFKDANDYPRIISSLKKKHNEIIGLMARTKLKIVSNFEDFERALVNNNQRSLQTAMQLINAKEEIEECYGLLKQLKENSEEDLDPKIKNLIDSRVFGSTAQVQYNHTVERRQLQDQKETFKNELISIVASKYAADVNCEILTEKIEKNDLSLKTLNQLKERLEKDRDDLENSINDNDATKEKLVKEISDPSRHIEFMRNCEERRKELDINFLNRMNLVRTKQVDILQDVEETRVLNKLYHLIFILDESGSMDTSFDLVRNSVYEIVQKRNEKTKSDERISIIKFDTSAEIEVLDASIRDQIEISDLSGGGTSFLKPLEKLEEILQSINSDIYIPVVFFLSDGYAESKSTVSTFCQTIYQRNSTFSFLFLSVGFGDDPDSETLKEMSKIFNNGCEVLKIGNEMIKLYHRANNQDQLIKVFTLYEKLFDYQKNLIQQKTEFLNNLMIETEKNRQKDSDILESIFEINQNSINNRIKESNKHAEEIENNLKNLNEICREKIKETSRRIKETEDSIILLEENKKECKKELSKIKPKRDEYEVSYEEFKEHYDQTNERYKEALKKEINGFDEVHKNAVTFRNENIEEQMRLFKELGIEFKDDKEKETFRKNYSDLQAHYFEFIKSKHDINDAASNLEIEMKNVVYYLELINKKLECCESLFTPDSIKGIIWDLVKFYLINKFKTVYKNNDEDFLYKVVSIEINSNKKKSNSCDSDDNDDDEDDDDEDTPSNRYKKAFGLVFKDLAPSSTFTKLEENESFVSSFLDFCTTKIDDIKTSVREANQSIRRIEKKEKNEKKQQEGIEKLEEEIEKLEEEIDEYKNYKSEIRKITNVINDFRLQAKERFLKEVMAKKVRSIFANVKTQLIPQIEVLKDSKTIRSIRN